VCVCACMRAGGAAKIYRKANCTPSTAARGSARDVTPAIPAALFNRSLFSTRRSDQHSDSLKLAEIFPTCCTPRLLW